MMRHLTSESRHGLSREDIAAQYEVAKLCHQRGEPIPTPINNTDPSEHVETLREKTAKLYGDLNRPTQHILMELPPDVYRIITEGFVRGAICHDLRELSLFEGAGMQSALEKLCLHIGAQHVWRGFAHSTAHDIIQQDVQEMWRRTRTTYAHTDALHATLRSDVWTDNRHRAYLGTMLEYVTADVQSMALLIGFQRLQGWSGPGIGTSHAAPAASTALKALWSTHVPGVEKPAWAQSDNANVAILIGRNLGCAALRCPVHILQIPMRV